MTREEYEDRKRRLDEQLRAGVELLEAAHRQQVRALDLVWMATTEEAVEIPRPAAAEVPRPGPQPAAPAPAPPAPPPKPRRREPGELRDEVAAALAQVPDVFDRNDLCRALGYPPDRGSLYRALMELVSEGVIAIEKRGEGKRKSLYKRLGPATPPAETRLPENTESS
jgi:hypothetical protein